MGRTWESSNAGVEFDGQSDPDLPLCLSSLDTRNLEASCTGCGATYPVTSREQLDLRPRGSKKYQLEIVVGEDSTGKTIPQPRPIPVNPDSQVDWKSVELTTELKRGNRLSGELMSWFPRSQQGGMMLDLGCGGEPFKKLCAQTNLEYVGIEYDGEKPRLLGDAHCLPFKDQSFDFAISFAVLEHLQHPLVALRELQRVLKPGALFIGTVAFLEPFHLNSYFHPSHLGTHTLLDSAGLEVMHLEPNISWTGLRAQAWMGLFPHAPMALTNLMVLPLHAMHRLWWKIGNAMQNRPATSEASRRTMNTGGFRFITRKPAA